MKYSTNTLINRSVNNPKISYNLRKTRVDSHRAGTGYIAKLGCQIKQTNLVFDDILLKTTHGITPLRFRAALIKIRNSIKPGNPTLLQDPSVRSNLNYYTIGGLTPKHKLAQLGH